MTDQPKPPTQTIMVVLYALICGIPVVGLALSFAGVIPEGGALAGDDDTRSLMSLVFLAIGLVDGAMSIVVPRLLKQADTFARRTVGMALSMSCAILGVVLMALIGDIMIPMVLWAAGAATGVQHLRAPDDVR